MARFPLVVVLTTGASFATTAQRQLEDLLGADALSALSHQWAHVQFNPVADALLSKALKGICASERMSLPSERLSALAASSNGDLRHAIHRLIDQVDALRE